MKKIIPLYLVILFSSNSVFATSGFLCTLSETVHTDYRGDVEWSTVLNKFPVTMPQTDSEKDWVLGATDSFELLSGEQVRFSYYVRVVRNQFQIHTVLKSIEPTSEGIKVHKLPQDVAGTLDTGILSSIQYYKKLTYQVTCKWSPAIVRENQMSKSGREKASAKLQ